MKRLAVFFLLIAVVAPRAGATAQAPDILKIGAKTYRLDANPLHGWLAANPGRLPQSKTVLTSLWRGYIATWTVRDKRLLLEDVRMRTDFDDDEMRSVMKETFGDAKPRVAAWFSGHLIVPTGELVKYVHMGYASRYESYLLLTVVRGEVRAQRQMKLDDFEKFRRAQYEAFRKTPEYAKARAEVTANAMADMSEKQREQFLFEILSGEYLSRIFEQ